MNPRRVELIYYSPTGTSRRVLEGVAKGIGEKIVGRIDLTPPEAANGGHRIPADSLAVFAVPVYGGRVPPVAARRLRSVKGNGTPAVLVAVYGNRAVEDALVELKDIAEEQGFEAVAAASFVGEHSFSNESTPIAPGRPDETDMKKAKAFGEKVKAKLAAAAEPAEVKIPGNRPYKERNPSGPRSPETNAETCTLCGACAEVCPTGAVIVSDGVETVKDTCTACSACVKACPTRARVWTDEGVKKAAAWLNKDYGSRREPEFFL